MKDERLIAIYLPKQDENWMYVETEKGLYEIRVGGVKSVECLLDINDFILEGQSKKGLMVDNVLTDGENVYIILEDQSQLSFGTFGVTNDGNLYDMFYITEKSDIDYEFLDEECYPVSIE